MSCGQSVLPVQPKCRCIVFATLKTHEHKRSRQMYESSPELSGHEVLHDELDTLQANSSSAGRTAGRPQYAHVGCLPVQEVEAYIAFPDAERDGVHEARTIDHVGIRLEHPGVSERTTDTASIGLVECNSKIELTLSG
jgi:hypothetical protein